MASANWAHAKFAANGRTKQGKTEGCTRPAPRTSVQELQVDRIPLDGERVIICKELVSAKRITQKLLLGVVQHTLAHENNPIKPRV